MDFFSGIIGHERPLAVLGKALAMGNLHHAYLFLGPGGVGKKTTAQAFARAVILSDDPQGEAYWRENVHPDFLNIERLEKKTQIGIEQINREMEPWLALKPYRASHRVVIINSAHLLSLPAANALLKTLEEPPAHAVIILVADEQMLLETIISRCQMVRFRLLSLEDLESFFGLKGMERSRASHLARLSQGSLTTAVQLASTDELEQLWQQAWTLTVKLASGDEIEIFKCAEEIEKQPTVMTTLLTTLLRDIFICQNTDKQDLLVVERNAGDYAKIKPLRGNRVLESLACIETLRSKFQGPIRSGLLSLNIAYCLRDALQ